MKIIAFSNQKGGVGKSTTAFNVAHLLAQDSSVLMVDLDPQSSLTSICGKDAEVEYSVYNLLRQTAGFNQIVLPINDRLDLLPATQELADLELEIVNVKGRERYLKTALEGIGKNYDYVVVDCPPSLNLLLVNALVAATHVIIPCETDYLAWKGVDLLLNSIAKVKTGVNQELKILGIVATFYNPRTLHSREIFEMLEEMEIPVITPLSSSTRVKDASLGSMPLHEYDKNNKIVEQYKKIEEAIKHG